MKKMEKKLNRIRSRPKTVDSLKTKNFNYGAVN